MPNPATCRPAITPYIAISRVRSWAVSAANDCRSSLAVFMAPTVACRGGHRTRTAPGPGPGPAAGPDQGTRPGVARVRRATRSATVIPVAISRRNRPADDLKEKEWARDTAQHLQDPRRVHREN